MTAIILHYYQHVLTGTVFNAFEYYLTILEHNPDIKLIMVNGPEDIWDYYSEIYEDRYYLDGIDYRKNMSVMDYEEFKQTVFDKVLVLDFGTIPHAKNINAKEIIVVSELHTDNRIYMFDKNQNATYYGEMPFVYKDHEYRMKLALDRLRKVDSCDEGIFVTSRANPEVIEEKLKLLPDKPVYRKHRTDHVQGFFSKWDELLYIRTINWFDPHPRIFIESAFYGKKMHYFNDDNVKDGGWYRWKDVQENGIQNRLLTKDDEIIRQFI